MATPIQYLLSGVQLIRESVRVISGRARMSSGTVQYISADDRCICLQLQYMGPTLQCIPADARCSSCGAQYIYAADRCSRREGQCIHPETSASAWVTRVL